MSDKKAVLITFLVILVIIALMYFAAYSHDVRRCNEILELVSGDGVYYAPRIGCLIQQGDSWSFFGK